jgi:hypothetical protein
MALPRTMEKMGRESLIAVVPKAVLDYQRLWDKKSLLRMEGAKRYESAGALLEQMGAAPTRVRRLADVFSEYIRRPLPPDTHETEGGVPKYLIIETLLAAVALQEAYRGGLVPVLAAVEDWAREPVAHAFLAEGMLQRLLDTVFPPPETKPGKRNSPVESEERQSVNESLDFVRSFLPPLKNDSE